MSLFAFETYPTISDEAHSQRNYILILWLLGVWTIHIFLSFFVWCGFIFYCQSSFAFWTCSVRKCLKNHGLQIYNKESALVMNLMCEVKMTNLQTKDRTIKVRSLNFKELLWTHIQPIIINNFLFFKTVRIIFLT